MSERQDANTVYIPVTGKQLGIAIAAIVTLVASFPVVNWITPDVRNDAYTGAEGAAMEKRSRERNAGIWAWIHAHEEFKANAQLEAEHRLTKIEQKCTMLENADNYNHRRQQQ